MAPSAPKRTHTALALIALMLAVAVVLTLCDKFCHLDQGVLFYTDPDAGSILPGQPTATVFFSFVGLAIGFVLLAAWIFAGEPAPGWRTSLMSLAAFIGLYYLTGALNDHPMLIFSGFLLLWLFHLRVTGLDQRKLVLLGVLLAVIGPVAEGWRAESGFFWYSDEDAYNVPLWLSALYLHGAIALAALTTTVIATVRGRAASQHPAP